MKQLDIFEYFSDTRPISKPSRSEKGRPRTVNAELIFETKKLISSKKKLSNDEIMKRLDIAKSTFYRIKKGEYDEILKKHFQDTMSDFSLELTD